MASTDAFATAASIAVGVEGQAAFLLLGICFDCCFRLVHSTIEPEAAQTNHYLNSCC